MLALTYRHRVRQIYTYALATGSDQTARAQADRDTLLTQLDQVLIGFLPLADFRYWFAGAFAAIEASGDETTIAFAHRVKSRLAEYSREQIDELRLLALLSKDVHHFTRAVGRNE